MIFQLCLAQSPTLCYALPSIITVDNQNIRVLYIYIHNYVLCVHRVFSLACSLEHLLITLAEQ